MSVYISNINIVENEEQRENEEEEDNNDENDNNTNLANNDILNNNNNNNFNNVDNNNDVAADSNTSKYIILTDEEFAKQYQNCDGESFSCNNNAFNIFKNNNNNTNKIVEVGAKAIWTVSSAKCGNGVQKLRDFDNNKNINEEKNTNNNIIENNINIDSYWQSDGSLPHVISVEFNSLTMVDVVAIRLNYNSDESYTPRVIVVYAGTTHYPRQSSYFSSSNNNSFEGNNNDIHENNNNNLENNINKINVHNYDGDCMETSRAEVDTPNGWLIIKMGNNSSTDNSNNNNDSYNNCICCRFLKIEIAENHQNGRDTHIRGVLIFGPSFNTNNNNIRGNDKNNFSEKNVNSLPMTSLMMLSPAIIATDDLR